MKRAAIFKKMAVRNHLISKRRSQKITMILATFILELSFDILVYDPSSHGNVKSYTHPEGRRNPYCLI